MNLSPKKKPTAFRMYFTVKMNRPVDRDKDFISPDFFEMTMGGKSIIFDFHEFCGKIDENDKTLVDFELKNPDYETFRDLKKVTIGMLQDVSQITEFAIDTDILGPEDTDLRPMKLERVSFLLPYDDWATINVPAEVVDAANAANVFGYTNYTPTR